MMHDSHLQAHNCLSPDNSVLPVSKCGGSGRIWALLLCVCGNNREYVLLQADGSAMCALQALWTQVREELQVVTIICANRTYAILKVSCDSQLRYNLLSSIRCQLLLSTQHVVHTACSAHRRASDLVLHVPQWQI